MIIFQITKYSSKKQLLIDNYTPFFTKMMLRICKSQHDVSDDLSRIYRGFPDASDDRFNIHVYFSDVSDGYSHSQGSPSDVSESFSIFTRTFPTPRKTSPSLTGVHQTSRMASTLFTQSFPTSRKNIYRIHPAFLLFFEQKVCDLLYKDALVMQFSDKKHYSPR